MGLLTAAITTALLLALFPLSLNSIPYRRKTVDSNDPLNDLLPETALEPENTQVGDESLQNLLDRSRNSRETEGSPSASKNSRKQSPKGSITPSSVKRTGNRRKRNPTPPDSPTLGSNAIEGNSDAAATDRGVSEPSTSTSNTSTGAPSPSLSALSTQPHKPANAKGGGPGDGLFAKEGALYRALYVVLALILLVILYLFIKFVMYAQSTSF